MTSAGRQPRFSTQVLVDLVMDPREPAYADAARRHGGHPPRRWYDQPLVAIGCLLAGFVLAIAYVHTHRGAPQAAKVHGDLVARVHAAESQANGLLVREQQLTGRLNGIRDQALGSSGTLSQQLQRAQLQAGQLAASGPGLEVTLAEPRATPATAAPGRGGSTPAASGSILTDRDVRSVVNELWAAGAEAIAVNGIRLTPTSAVRFAGEAVLVDFQPISSPYTITAIGDTDGLATGFASSEVASRYQTLSSAKGIEFSFAEKPHLSVPAGPGTTLRYAHTAGGHR